MDLVEVVMVVEEHLVQVLKEVQPILEVVVVEQDKVQNVVQVVVAE